jgi:protein-S-isoprenylcysteine O-methyltransferase Ste14
MDAKLFTFVDRRLAWSRLAIALAFFWALLMPPPAVFSSFLLETLELLGFGLLALAAFGRLWCLSYIAGAKNEVLVTQGPYSVVRNPLYLFNFVGAVGFGLAIENPLLALLLAAGFATFYPGVVEREESTLARAFPEEYARYRACTPRWLPRWSNYREPTSWTISPRRFRAGLLDAMWFLWAFMLWEALEASGLLQWIRLF